MNEKVRLAVQAFALILAGLLMFFGFQQFNILFILGSLGAALVAGRVFCGWFCPLGFWTERIIPKIKRTELPRAFKQNWFRYAFASFFILLFTFLASWNVINKSLLPLILMFLMFALATLIGVLTYNKAWCAYLCPWGILGSLISRLAPNQLSIDEKCRKCLKCTSVCPLGDILEEVIDDKGKKGGSSVISSRCIRCLSCADVCPQGAIGFQSRNDLKIPQPYTDK